MSKTLSPLPRTRNDPGEGFDVDTVGAMNPPSGTIVPVVLSGGAGTRLWPASRAKQPKQLLPLASNRSMIAATIDRVHAIGGAETPIVVTNASQATAVQRALRDSGYDDATLILEPVGRNTAPAVAVAALEVLESRGDALMLVLPADHVITDEGAFAAALASGVEVAERGALVTFGITPTSPETGYGYIRAGDPITSAAREIAEFKEKPDEATAAEYLASGAYSWNSGMFLFQASRFLDELEEHRPDIASASKLAHAEATTGEVGVELHPDHFAACPAESIDYAVMERTSSGAVVSADPGWSDVGSWSALWDIADKDGSDNALVGDVIAVDTSDSYIRADTRLVATIGLDGVVVVDTPDSVLVASMAAVQDVKAIVENLKADNRPEATENEVTFEPWGTSRVLSETPGHRTLLLSIDPGATTNDHSHDDRSHHWQFFEGTAEVHIGGEASNAGAGDSVYIEPGATHNLTNTGPDVLTLVQVSVDTRVSSREIADYLNRRGSTPC